MLMSEREWTRKDVLKRHAAGRLTTSEAAKILGLSARQLRRLAATLAAGDDCFVHGNRGRAPPNKASESLRRKVLGLFQGRYQGFNDSHFVEMLREQEGVRIGRATFRRWARAEGLNAVRKRRARRYRQRRDREAREGAMLLWDGSTHEWLEERGPRMCLVAAIDDATGRVMPGGHFVKEESAAAYLRVLAGLVKAHGIPLRIYMDRHGSLKRNDDHWTMEEELAGAQTPTQVGLALEELRVESIFALSPEAKGRVERLWGTLQDRLVSEMRLAGIRTMEEANQFLPGFIERHNRRFGRKPREAETAWRPVPATIDVDEACAFRYVATVGNDNIVSIDGVKLQIPRPVGGRSYAKATLEVRQLVTGAWRLRLRGQHIATIESTAPAVELRARRRRRRGKASQAFRELVRTIPAAPEESPPQKGKRQKPRAPPRPFNIWSKKQKIAAAKKSKQLREQRPASW